MFCPKCGNQVDQNMAFCNKCGANLNNKPTEIKSDLFSPIIVDTNNVEQNPIEENKPIVEDNNIYNNITNNSEPNVSISDNQDFYLPTNNVVENEPIVNEQSIPFNNQNINNQPIMNNNQYNNNQVINNEPVINNQPIYNIDDEFDYTLLEKFSSIAKTANASGSKSISLETVDKVDSYLEMTEEVGQ